MSFFNLMRLWPRQECKKTLRTCQESKKTLWPRQEQLQKISFFKLQRLWPHQEGKKSLRRRQESKKTLWPRQEQAPKNKLFQIHEAMATQRGLKDAKAMPTAQQVQKMSLFKLMRLWPRQEYKKTLSHIKKARRPYGHAKNNNYKNKLLQAPEAMAMPRAQEDPKATSRKQEASMATVRTPTTKKLAFFKLMRLWPRQER